MTNLIIGLVVNPIAGIGASLAWKGTDNVFAAWEAVESGVNQSIWELVNRALTSVPSHITINWILGASYPIKIEAEAVSSLPKRSTSKDTIAAVKLLTERQPDLILFAGGDGTAADVAKATDLPILGIPGGVKIYSPVFLHRPEDFGQFLESWQGETSVTDLLDLDEDAYRRGEVHVKLITSATIPVSTQVQSGKISWGAPDSETFNLIAERITDDGLLKGIIAVGPGSTMKRIFQFLGIELSLLGVDIVKDGIVEILDARTDQLEEYVIDEIWITPIGNQGHIFGRGNRQISPKLIKHAKIRIFATMEKARETDVLFVDTGDPELDNTLRGFKPVIVGYHEEIMKRIS